MIGFAGGRNVEIQIVLMGFKKYSRFSSIESICCIMLSTKKIIHYLFSE